MGTYLMDSVLNFTSSISNFFWRRSYFEETEMGRFGSSRFGRIEADPDQPSDDTINPEKSEVKVDRARAQEAKGSLKSKVLSRVFSENYERAKHKILNPRGEAIHQWNKAFLVSYLVSLFLDPMFFYLPLVKQEHCVDMDKRLRIVLTVIRTIGDVFHVIQIVVRFHTAFVEPSSTVVGRGELVVDSAKIALRYLRGVFWVDLLIALPLPQVLVWLIAPNIGGWGVFHSWNVLWFMLIIQYLSRLYFVFPLSSRIVEATGVLTKTAIVGATYNYLIFWLSGHVFGAFWYLMSIQRQEDCWHWICNIETNFSCPQTFFDCRNSQVQSRVNWYQSSNITNQCNPNNNMYQFGIMGDAVRFSVQEVRFLRKYLYCLWWGLKNMSTLGQSFTTSTYVGENVFSCIIIIVGLTLLALLIGNVQRYLFSTTRRLEDWKIQRSDTENWMRHRELPPGLRGSVRKYDLYKWLTTRGVDEESMVTTLPNDLQRKIKRHLCLNLLQRVPLFNQMEDIILDAICERLKPALCTKGRFLVREGDPVKQMFFIIRGLLDSYTAGTRMMNLCRIAPGDFCGEELLTWALDPNSGDILPTSLCTIKAVDEVEAFSLSANDLKFVASQFRRLHSKKVRQIFRFYSHQWRAWAARTIQVAWRKYKESKSMGYTNEPGMPSPGSFWSLYAEDLVANTRQKTLQKISESESKIARVVEKPEDPDFSED